MRGSLADSPRPGQTGRSCLGVKGSRVQIPPSRLCDVSRHRNGPEPALGFGVFCCGAAPGGAFGCAGGLVVAGGVEGEFAELFAGGGVDDADVQVLDEEQDGGAGVDAADADVVEFPAGAQGDGAAAAMMSLRTRWWVSAVRSPGTALGRAA